VFRCVGLRCLCNNTISTGESTASRIAARTGGERTLLLITQVLSFRPSSPVPAAILLLTLSDTLQVCSRPILEFRACHAMHDLRTEHEAKAVRADVNKEFNWLISTTLLPWVIAPALPSYSQQNLSHETPKEQLRLGM